MREATSVAGHAVRQLYLPAAVTDLAIENGDDELRAVAERLWDAMVSAKTYLTGGLGARHEGEAFGEPYELPPDRAYAKTCAAIASIQWSWRMALLTGDAKYSDLVERTLCNGFLAGAGLDGDSWLYVNPLQVREEYEGGFEPDKTARRTPWFRCTCCPPNVMRLLASLPHYMAGGDAEGLQLHQYATGVCEAGGGRVRVETAYPWQGRITVTVEEAPAETHPGWLRLRRRWSPGDTLTLDLAWETRLTRPDPYVDAVRGCAAIERGPLVHCLKAVDQPPGLRFEDLTLPHGTRVTGVTVVTADGRTRGAEDVVPLTAVPYYAWANRRPGAMRVWIPRE